MKKLTVGVVGAGRIGQLHIGNMLKSNLYQLKAISDVRLSNATGTSSDPLKNFFLDRYHEAYAEEIESFAQAILLDQPLACSGVDGEKAQLLAKAAKLSYQEQRTVKLAELEKQTTV